MMTDAAIAGIDGFMNKSPENWWSADGLFPRY